ncbi:MAG TPA: rubrerythrin family protein [Phycisphaerae bacterium]|nr:rubrerythrin family protein [Phycisphaerae bacterium]HOI54534.1 rubrerythrin family protein [Phycisphaerae bacterium]
MSNTERNVRAAFAGESQANRKYLAFAKVAEKEGQSQIARLFRAAAEAETIHAHAHLAAMGGIGTTAKNLDEAIHGETYEFEKMYPDFITEAEAEENKTALRMFRWANEVEAIHAALYRKYKAALDAGEALPATKLYVCDVCGNTVEDEPPDRCPVCGAARKAFKEIQ